MAGRVYPSLGSTRKRPPCAPFSLPSARGGLMLRLWTGLIHVECGLGSDKAAQVEDGLGITAEVPSPSIPS